MSADEREEAKTMALTVDRPAATKPSSAKPGGPGKQSRRRSGRRHRGQATDGVRYFVGKPGEPDRKPTLEQEVASEPEALVIAFKNDSRVYFVSEHRVTMIVSICDFWRFRSRKGLAIGMNPIPTERKPSYRISTASGLFGSCDSLQ